MRKINEVGSRYGRWLVIAESVSADNYAMWLCRCDCGNEAVVQGGNLRAGLTNSCGCWRSDLRKELNSKQSGINHPQYTDGARCGLHTNKQKEFHESIRKRDNYTCQDCGKAQEQELSDAGWRLSVHHKDGDHFHNTDENAVTLCQSCHQKVHRTHHDGERRKMEKAKRDQQDLDIMYAVAEQEQLDKN